MKDEELDALEALEKQATPGPWRIDKCNDDGIDVVGDNGHLIYSEDFGGIQTERGAAFHEQIVQEAIANASLIVTVHSLLASARRERRLEKLLRDLLYHGVLSDAVRDDIEKELK